MTILENISSLHVLLMYGTLCLTMLLMCCQFINLHYDWTSFGLYKILYLTGLQT